MFFVNRTPLSFGGTGAVDGGAGLDGGSGTDGGLPPYQSVDCPATMPTQSSDPVQAAQQAIQAAVTAAAGGSPPVSTYFVVLNNSQHTTAVSFFNGITGATTLDATSMQPAQVLATFANTASALGTCLYEAPPGVDSSATLKFYGQYPIPYAAACSATAPDSVNGWNLDNGRIRVCGLGQDPTTMQPRSCTAIRNAVLALTAQALQMDASVPDVPVTVEMRCKDRDAGP
jgi:hypothetical protein